ncbi:hypothetical protein [Conexibacter woesei]|uniref:Uncharacterized protein n=1 Tax=Conexibacter woesei (strain DSM 14684 / CCUG 47730 / CIP 108061 / JCM 11494 / NBRC 100937 / ID131577) TaxID=469383 RepID=D3FD14_CONWI|nr:hypothetical protein [Conexibacter woesei]ADB51526.1 hypothetical protein Cwoe_3107 [Conexibacter woesei DSM 14684]
MLPWSDRFASNDFIGWSWWGAGDTSYGLISTPRADDERIPRWRTGFERVGRFQVADPARLHAKVYKTWSPNGVSPADVSGSYRASYYVPSSYGIPPSAGATNIFQWKENVGGSSDPTWWVNMGGARWALSVGGARWIGPRPSGSDDRPVLFLNYWDNRWTRQVVFMQVPRDQWFEIRADVHEGVRIDFSVDGTAFDTALDSEYPVGTFARGGTGWTFGVGNYTQTLSTLYVGEAKYQPFDEPDGWEQVGHTEAIENGTSGQTKLPPGLTDGDALVMQVILTGDRAATAVTPTGWTKLSSHVTTGDVGTWLLYATTYRAGSTPAPLLQWGGASTGWTYGLGAYRGADDVTPVDTHATQVSGTPTLTPTSPAITTALDDSLLVWNAYDFWGWFASAWPAGFTANGPMLADKVAARRGSVAAQAGAFPSADTSWGASIVALKPRDYTP